MRQKNNRGVRVLVAGCALQFLLGILYVWSVFVKPVSEHLDWNIDGVKLTASFMLCFFAVGMLAGGKLQAKIGTKLVTLIGGLGMAAGMLISSFARASAPQLIYVSYGILGGLSVGMAYNAIVSCAPRWFPDKKGFVTGVSICSFGFSTVVFAPLIEKLVAVMGLAAAFRVLALVFGAATLLLFSFIVMPESAAAGAAAGGSGRQYTTSELLKTPKFYFLVVSLMLGIATYFVLNPSFKTLALERGMADSLATGLVMSTGIANALGRLAIPVLSDKAGSKNAALVIMTLTAACGISLVFAKGTLLFAAIALAAFCYGGYPGLYLLLTGEHFGMKHVASNYGAVMLGFSLAALVFPMLIGNIPGDTAKFVTLAMAAAIGAALVLFIKKKDKLSFIVIKHERK